MSRSSSPCCAESQARRSARRRAARAARRYGRSRSCAVSPGPNARGCRSSGQPLASAARALGPPMRSTARPSLWSATDARPAELVGEAVGRCARSSETASHCSGPAQTRDKALPPASDRPGRQVDAIGRRKQPRELRQRAVPRDDGCETKMVAGARPSRRAARPRGRCRPAGRRPAQGALRQHPAVDGGGSATEPLSRRDRRRPALQISTSTSPPRTGSNARTRSPIRSGPRREQAEADPVAERRRERDRGHVALVVLGRRRRAERDEMRAGAQPLGAVDRPEARRASAGPGRRSAGRSAMSAADEVLLGRHHARRARGRAPWSGR